MFPLIPGSQSQVRTKPVQKPPSRHLQQPEVPLRVWSVVTPPSALLTRFPGPSPGPSPQQCSTSQGPQSALSCSSTQFCYISSSTSTPPSMSTGVQRPSSLQPCPRQYLRLLSTTPFLSVTVSLKTWLLPLPSACPQSLNLCLELCITMKVRCLTWSRLPVGPVS